MTTNQVLILFLNLVFFSYMGLIIAKFGVLDSISLSFYKFAANNDRPWTPRFLFILFAFLLGFPFIFIMPGWHGFVPGACLLVLGTAANYRSERVELLHVVAAISSIATAGLTTGLHYGHGIQYLLVEGFIIALIYLFIKKNRGFWAEIAGFVIVDFFLIINNF